MTNTSRKRAHSIDYAPNEEDPEAHWYSWDKGQSRKGWPLSDMPVCSCFVAA
ncbi:hypothetical protein [Paenibacillus sp. 7516]|uniref:hypothetical protein n=1 Tax=Paenibacillus sp. 7516 TaxID=2022549 RepID=UPI00148246CA|nr:hypothetical protein [Paenibacillus sp. 7516]